MKTLTIYLLPVLFCVTPALAEPPDQLNAETQPWRTWGSALGDSLGIRPALADHGVEIYGGYTAEVWGNTTGGLKQGAVYTGLLDFGAEVDLEKAIGWQGASFNTTWLWLSGRDASEELAGNFLTISNIAGFETLRMLELWFQQDLFQREDGPSGLSIRLGQLTADSEFVTSDYASLFINGTFGWPAFLYTNLPEGGPGYPMGTLGFRVAVSPWEWMTFQSAVFQGNVFAQNVNRHGFRWDLNADQGYLWMNEAQFRWNQDPAALPGQVKFGAWFHTADFENMDSSARDFDAHVDPANETHPWNFGFYSVVDQMLYREPGESSLSPAEPDGKTITSFKGDKRVVTTPSNQGLGWFGRIAFEHENRNFVSFYFDTGLAYTGLIPTRDEDQLGVAFGYAQISSGSRRTLESEGARGVGAEMVLEVTYQAVITPWLTIQPDVQFIINPGGTQDLNNAFVIGARAAITF